VGLGHARRSKRGASTRTPNQSARGRSRSLLRQAFRCTRPGVNGGYPETGLRQVVLRRSGALRQKRPVHTARWFARHHRPGEGRGGTAPGSRTGLLGYLRTDRTRFRLGLRRTHRRTARGARTHRGIKGPGDGCFGDRRIREIVSSQTGRESNDCRLQDYCNPFPERCQRKRLTQSRIPGANISRIPAHAGARGPTCG
jgi:hypothetical protein